MRYTPMLAKLSKEPFNESDYLYEPKYDGIRAIVYFKGPKDYIIINRSGNDVTDRFPELVFKAEPCVLDGELVCFDEKGIPDFQAMQTRMNRIYNVGFVSGMNPASYVAFDILEYLGEKIIDKPLLERKHLLEKALKATENVLIAPYEVGTNEKTLEMCKNWEGVIGKQIDSKYLQGRRTQDWMKIKPRKTDTFTILGITPGTGKRAKHFGALIMGFYSDSMKKYIHVGDVGTGFEDMELDDILELLRLVETDEPTIKDYKGPVLTWCQPVIKCNVSYLEMSNDAKMRHPAYEGLVLND